VVYAGAAGVALPSTPGNHKVEILEAIDRLYAGGATAGGAGIVLAYDIATRNCVSGNGPRRGGEPLLAGQPGPGGQRSVLSAGTSASTNQLDRRKTGASAAPAPRTQKPPRVESNSSASNTVPDASRSVAWRSTGPRKVESRCAAVGNPGAVMVR
jgi:hypothetical protein